ncbi:MAG: GNAT family N-acetyltransferase [Chloroflexota bacterium]|nr:GNAT family N-acetyltransferase [Chloroflexota bacterium]
MASEYNIEVVSTPSELQKVLELRVEVFVLEQAVPEDEEIDALDTLEAIANDQVIHVIVSENGSAIGTARLILEGSKSQSDNVSDFPHIGRVAVKKNMRLKGIGEVLMVKLHQIANSRGFAGVTLSAQLQAAPFYTRLGYTERGSVYDDVGIPHQDMDLIFG